MKKRNFILGIIGSPRKNGNTDFVIDKILQSASENGAISEKIYLNELKIKPCQGCEHCKKYKNCKIKDDFAQIIKKIENADGIVIGSPVYFGTISAQTKIFIDRLFSLFDKDFNNKLKGKRKGAFVLIWAAEQKFGKKLKPTKELLESILKSPLNADVIGSITKGCLADIGDAAKNKELQEKSARIAKRLVGVRS